MKINAKLETIERAIERTQKYINSGEINAKKDFQNELGVLDRLKAVYEEESMRAMFMANAA